MKKLLQKIKYNYYRIKGIFGVVRIEGKGKLKRNIANKIFIHPKAKLIVNGVLELSINQVIPNTKRSILVAHDFSEIKTEGNFKFGYGADIVVFNNAKLELGRDSYVNNNCYIRCSEKIIIGNNCAIACNFTAMDSDFHYINGKVNKAPIIIGNHVWIGCNVTILSGVTIGDGAVIGAGAVVVKNIPKRTLVAGVPARVIKHEIEWN